MTKTNKEIIEEWRNGVIEYLGSNLAEDFLNHHDTLIENASKKGLSNKNVEAQKKLHAFQNAMKEFVEKSEILALRQHLSSEDNDRKLAQQNEKKAGEAFFKLVPKMKWK